MKGSDLGKLNRFMSWLNEPYSRSYRTPRLIVRKPFGCQESCTYVENRFVLRSWTTGGSEAANCVGFESAAIVAGLLGLNIWSVEKVQVPSGLPVRSSVFGARVDATPIFQL